MSNDTDTILYQGASVAQLSKLFGMSPKTIKEKLHTLKPSAHKGAIELYAIREAAERLVTPAIDLDEFIASISHHDQLPPLVRKEFWAGMRSRQIFEKEAGELWPTEKVIENVSALLKTLKMSLQIARDTVERETELSERQRKIITNIIDGALEEMYATVQEKFRRGSTPSDESPSDGDAEETSEEVL